MNVYECINAVSAELSKEGISKTRSNAQQGYKFRGVDEVMNALSPILAKHGLVILPRMIKRECAERATKSGGAMYSVTVDAEFDFVSIKDQSKHTVATFGEAMDSGDKATNKSMSAAYKYAAFLAFCIPLEGSADADATTPEETVTAKAPAGYPDWLHDMEACADEGVERLKKAWTNSTPEVRKYLTDTNSAKWEAMKAKAAKVDAAQQVELPPARTTKTQAVA